MPPTRTRNRRATTNDVATAAGQRNALSVLAVADRGSMLDASSVFYMDKIVTDADGIGIIDIDRPVGDNIRALAKAKGKDVGETRVAVLDRPRHAQLIDDIPPRVRTRSGSPGVISAPFGRGTPCHRC